MHSLPLLTPAIQANVEEALRVDCFGNGAGQTDRRGTARARTVFTIGKVIVGDVEHPCMVRDLSAGGMQIQMPAPPPVGAHVVIEMRGMRPTPATVRWRSERGVGLQFDAPCDVAQIFHARTDRISRLTRSPRFTLARRGSLRMERATLSVIVADISVGGAKLLTREPIVVGDIGELVVGLALGGPAGGEIRWIGDNVCGFRFARPLSSVALAHALQSARG
jgi:hypothetical protein